MTNPIAASVTDLLEELTPLLDVFNNSDYAEHGSDDDACDFMAGNPQEMPLPGFVDAIRAAAIPQNKEWFAYKFSEPSAQEIVANGLQQRTGLAYHPDDIALTTGAFAALSCTFRTIANPGDEIVMMTPPWFFYEAMIKATGAVPVKVALDPPDFDLPLEAIEAALTDRTRAVIVNTPHNPAGRVFTEEELRDLAALLEQASARFGRTISMISDEAYNRIVYSGSTFVAPATVYPETFTIYTYGKQLLTPGERIGYIALHPDMQDREQIRSGLMITQALVGWAFPNATLQYAIGSLEELGIDLAALERKRDRLLEGLRAAGYDVATPEGTFYLLPKSPIEDDQAFVRDLAGHKVFALPGSLMEIPGYFRISDTASDEMIERALPIFANAIDAVNDATR